VLVRIQVTRASIQLVESLRRAVLNRNSNINYYIALLNIYHRIQVNIMYNRYVAMTERHSVNMAYILIKKV